MNAFRILLPFLLLGICGAAKLSAAEPAKPNLLFLLSDDQRWDAMGCAGNPVVRTPELDRLAAEGTRFVNAFVTSSVCAASRASIFMGQYERAHHCNFNSVSLQRAQLEKSYPWLLRAAGYHTGFIGKYGVADLKHDIEGAEVFDRWFGFYGQGLYFPKAHGGKHLNEITVEQAREFLRGVPAGKPFCLSVSFKAPHSGRGYLSFEPEPDLRDLYANLTVPHPPTARAELFDALPEFLRTSNARTNYWEQRFSTEEKFQSNMKDYYRLITGMDRAIGRIRAALAENGFDRNTVVIFLSDNGDMHGDYGIGGKQLLYDASLRVPLVVCDPRAPAAARGRPREELALNIDIAPTLLDYAGVPAPRGMQGRSLAPIARGESPAWRDDFFCENNFRQRDQAYPLIEGVRTVRWKYARYPELKPVVEQLFDLTADPQEIHDLARAPERAADLSRLRARCDALCGEAAGKAP